MTIKILQLILSLSILVILHELGHFIPAKLFKTKVEKFYLFFDIKFSLFKKKIGDTVYGIGWLPLGGYVKIAGMIDESMDTEQMNKPAEPWEFRSKPAWQRLIIMAGGVIMNIILAFFIYICIVYVWGTSNVDKASLQKGISVSPEMEVFGFQNEDHILSVDGEEIDVLDINKYLLLRDVSIVKVRHANNIIEEIKIPDTIGTYMFKHNLEITPRTTLSVAKVNPDSPATKAGIVDECEILKVNDTKVFSIVDIASAITKDTISPSVTFIKQGDTITSPLELNANKKLGVYIKNNIEIIHKEYGFFESISKGMSYGYWTLHDYIAQLRFFFTEKGSQSLGGFISITNLFEDQWNWQSFWNITALLSIILGVMNILPIPALDGGHIVFLFYEIITRKQPKQKILEYAQIVGFFLLIGLLVYANANDIYKLIIK